jgi:hypothetical protein
VDSGRIPALRVQWEPLEPINAYRGLNRPQGSYAGRRNQRVKAQGDVVVTTIDAAAARNAYKRFAIAAWAALLGGALGGCESSGNLFGGTDNSLAQNVAPAPVVESSKARVSIAPVIGAPDAVAKQLSTMVTESVERQRVTLVKGQGEKADYTVRGYVVAAREKNGSKVSYIWDVTDANGKRVNRISGEEIVAGGGGGDPWGAVTPQVLQTIATKTSTSLATWLPSQSQGAIAGASPSPAGVGAQTRQTASIGSATETTARAQLASVKSGGAEAATTGSIPVTAVVPAVTGAPGDGSQSLTSAIRAELERSGVSLSDRTGSSVYKVEGKVTMSDGKEGKQAIKIDWLVTDPQGKQLGKVSQKNDIQQGSLDGNWGKTADLAAAAAAQGILKLLKQPNSAVN